jgi:hypothetical protein
LAPPEVAVAGHDHELGCANQVSSCRETREL